MKQKKNNGAIAHTIMGKNYALNQRGMLARPQVEANHSKFTLLENNRVIYDKHVASLVASIVKNGQMQPIVVSKDLEVIDGQHRLEACKELDLPVCYIIHEKATSKEIAVINNTQKGWTQEDYIRHFSHKNHRNCAEYKKLKKFKEDHNLPYSVIFLLMRVKVTNSREDQSIKSQFVEGTFKVEDLELAEERAKQILKFKSFNSNIANKCSFVFAFLKCKELDNFSLHVAYKQIEKNARFFDMCGSTVQAWVEAFEKAYNHRLVTNGSRFKKYKKISIRKEGF